MGKAEETPTPPPPRYKAEASTPPPPRYGIEAPAPVGEKLSFGEGVKGFLFGPKNTFNRARANTVGDGFKYYIVLLLIFSALYSVTLSQMMITYPLSPGQVPISEYRFGSLTGHAAVGPGGFVVALMGGIVGVFIVGAWMHLWVYIFGGRKGITQTWKACMYGATPIFILGWVVGIVVAKPFTYLGMLIALLVAIWTLIVAIIGVRQLHEISTGRAVAAVLLATIIPVMLAMLAIAGVIKGIIPV